MPTFLASQKPLMVSLARWSAPADPAAFEAECAKLQDKKDFAALATKLRTAMLAKLASANEADGRNAFAILLQLLVQWKVLAAQAEPLADELVTFGSKGEAAGTACTLLLALYPVVQEHAATSQVSLLMTLISFCAKNASLGRVLGPVEQRIERVERWVAEWTIKEEQQRELWALIFDTHTEEAAVLYEAAIKYFALHEKADLKASPKELRDRIVMALMMTIRSPDLFRCDELSQSSVVAQLEKDAEFAPLHRLLHILAQELYGEFLAFVKQDANAKFMQKHDLPRDACADKMRLLTLVSLAHANKELRYDKVAAELQIDASEVEKWVMLAIGNGLITAKMDQVQQTIAVSMCAERDFGTQQWERLHTSLVGWRESIRSLLDVVQQSRPTA